MERGYVLAREVSTGGIRRFWDFKSRTIERRKRGEPFS